MKRGWRKTMAQREIRALKRRLAESAKQITYKLGLCDVPGCSNVWCFSWTQKGRSIKRRCVEHQASP